MEDGLIDAVEAFFEAGKSGDFEEAASAFKDMKRLCDSGCSEEGGEGEKKGEGAHGKPLVLSIGMMGKK